jgi:hypothetical protein
MYSLSKKDNPEFSRKIRREVVVCLAVSFFGAYGVLSLMASILNALLK